MSNSVDATLQDAFDLIEQNQLKEARTILEPLLLSDRDNPAVWWIYAHAVDTPEEGNQALDKVLQLDPTYPGASDLKAQITASQTSVSMDDNDDVDDWDDLDFEPDAEFSGESTSEKKHSPVRFLLFAILVIIVVIAIFAVLSGVFGASAPSPTEVAVNTEIPTINSQIVATEIPTEEATSVPATDIVEATEVPPTDEVEPTEIPATEEPTSTTVPPTEEPTDIPPTDTVEPTEETDSSTAAIVSALSEYEVKGSDVEVRTTLLGETMVVSVCATPGPESSLVLNDVMDILVASNSTIGDEVEAIAVSLVDCTNDEGSTRTIGVERAVVQQLSDDEIELKDFQRAWQPLP